MSLSKDKNAKGATDILKVLVVLSLPFVHSIGIIAMNGFCTESLGNVSGYFSALLVFGGPVFLICLGIDLLENRSGQSIIQMGIEISLINLVFNLIRFGLPDSIMIFAGLYSPKMWILDLAAGDIYAFIGLFCILYGLARKANFSLTACTLIACGLFALNLFLSQHLLPVDDVIGYYLGNFISGYAGSFFTLLGWSIFPCIGMLIGKVMKLEMKKRNRAFGFILLGTIAAFAVLSVILSFSGTNVIQLVSDNFSSNDYSLFKGIVMALSGIFAVSLACFIYGHIPENKFEKKVITLSNLVMPFYLIHFAILCWLIYGTEFVMIASGHSPILIGTVGFLCLSVGTTAVTAFICYKRGFTFTRWLFKIFNYRRWFHKTKS